MAKVESTETVEQTELSPKIVVIGVGGAGGNAVNNMIRSNLEGVTFVVANTDAQALKQSLAPSSQRIQLGLSITKGLGAGSKPDIGKAAAEESSEDVLKFIEGANMLFITAGMGGGTGTGAAPVIAKIAKDAGILTVGVVTCPFTFEGAHRAKTAESGIDELQQFVDTLLIIPNQNLFRLANENTTFADAFKMADDVLYSGVRGVTDLMIMPGLINLDFADIRAVMSEMGKAMMGTGEAEGERRALDAAETAIANPLLDDVSLQGARGVLISITGGHDMTLYEVDEAANKIREEVDSDANIIFGSTFDERLNGKIRVSIVATGIGVSSQESIFKNRDKTGIMGFGKRDISSKMFEETSNKDDITRQEPPAVELNNINQNDNKGYPKNQDFNKEQPRRKSSFFDRFTSKSKNTNAYDNDYDYDRQQNVSRETLDDIEQDELDIPSCFRKKK
ncbi:MAG: cell division protein FtsZ [Holosporales bacterium]|jgi:cell division protein FtsZ|nr:cell division protein FtsZ [Holosporales bacterium]